MNSKKVAFLCFFQDGRISGPSNSVTELAKFVGDNITCDVYTTKKGVKSFVLNDIKIFPYEELFSNLPNYKFVVLAGIYDHNIYRASRICRSMNIPYIISPRSNLMQLSAKKSKFKKKLAKLLFINRMLKEAKCIHYLSEEERENSVSPNPDYFVARNGVNFVNINNTGLQKENIISFVGRIDIHHKGLDLLFDSLAIKKDVLLSNNWVVILRGPSTIKSLKEVNKMLAEYGLLNLVQVGGPVVGHEKFCLLAKSKIFVHPSRYEGQPQAVIEAMAMGCIPVTTIGANMKEAVKSWHPSVGFDKYDFSSSLVRATKYANDFDVDGLITYTKDKFDWNSVRAEFFRKCNIKGLI